jgi:inorganic pyrophosphatase/exopolyphosphatase
METIKVFTDRILISAGSTYLDIDAYACIAAMAELLCLQGQNAFAYSTAPCNYSVCPSLMSEGQINRELPVDIEESEARYIIVDVSDPEFLKSSVPLHRVIAVYDHHTGFEEYWQEKIGDGAHIEFIGAAATLIYREWNREGLQEQMSLDTARLLLAAILDNTLNLTSSNTTEEDREAFTALCRQAGVGDEFRAEYFSEVQKGVEEDLKNALWNDVKTVRNNPVLPPRVAQLCVWNAEGLLEKLPEIRKIFAEEADGWMVNLIDIQHGCNYFICDDARYQENIERIFGVRFCFGAARTDELYLRKEIIRKTQTIK